MDKAKLITACLIGGVAVWLYVELAPASSTASGEPFKPADVPQQQVRSTRPTNVVLSHSVRTDEDSEELRDLRRRIDMLEHGQASGSARAEDSPRLDPVRDPEAYDAMLAEHRDRAYNELMEVFDAEARTEGTQDAEAEISIFFEEKWDGVEVGDVDCNARMCRTELSFMGESHLNSFLEDGLNQSPLRYGGQFLQRGDEPSDYVVFTARKGQKLAKIMRNHTGDRK